MNTTNEILASERLRRHCRYSTFLGITVWWGVFALQPASPTWDISLFLLFVPLVLFRLSFPMLVPPSPVRNRLYWYGVSYAQPLAAISLAISFLYEPGTIATFLALPWVIFSGYLALLAVDRLLYEKPNWSNLGPIAGMLLMPVGAAWTLAFKANVQPLEFNQTIVLLTGVHFHYAGFVLPILLGQLVMHQPSRASKFVFLGMITAVPLVAIGITATQLGGPKEVEFGCVLVFAVLGILFGILNWRLTTQLPKIPAMLIAISGVSLGIALCWSAAYASSQYGLFDGVTIPMMVQWHGSIQSLGFAFCGLLGWHFVTTKIACGEK